MIIIILIRKGKERVSQAGRNDGNDDHAGDDRQEEG